MSSAFISVTVNAPILKQDFRQALADQMSTTTPMLAKTLEGLVRDKTRVDTGALSEDITSGYRQPGPNFGLLAEVFTGTENQLEWWNRIYVAYQEGGVLGKSTYTNPPRLMFYDTAMGDGLDAVLAWGVANVLGAVAAVQGKDGMITPGD